MTPPNSTHPTGTDPDHQPPPSNRTRYLAYILPFGLFLGFLALTGAVNRIGNDLGLGRISPLLIRAEFWIYPLQTLVCGLVMLRYRKEYQFLPHAHLPAAAAGILALLVWIAPQAFLGFPPRLDGFDPTHLADNPTAYWFSVGMRFVRLVIIVPFLEEIFWRSFLMRYLINERFWEVPFGRFAPIPFFLVAGLFTLAHSPADYAAAFLTGLIYNGLACLTRSLSACVVAHALTNLLLGLYIMATGQWGFW